MFEHLAVLNEKHVAIVANAIADDRIGCVGVIAEVRSLGCRIAWTISEQDLRLRGCSN